MSEIDFEYTVRRGKRSNIRVSVGSGGKVTVYAPKSVSLKYVRAFVEENAEKIFEMRKKATVRSYDALYGDIFSPALMYLGKRCAVVFNNGKKFRFESGKFYSPTDNLCETASLFREFLRAEAKKYIPERTASLAAAFGFEYSKLTIKAVSSRWGSCSAKKNLNFSLALMVCEPEFIDSVILHELCHTVHLDHGKEFHALLDKVCPENEILRTNGKTKYSGIPAMICG